jgi:hypothetical protein
MKNKDSDNMFQPPGSDKKVEGAGNFDTKKERALLNEEKTNNNGGITIRKPHIAALYMLKAAWNEREYWLVACTIIRAAWVAFRYYARIKNLMD